MTKESDSSHQLFQYPRASALSSANDEFRPDATSQPLQRDPTLKEARTIEAERNAQYNQDETFEWFMTLTTATAAHWLIRRRRLDGGTL
jgi:hypothetical protein